MIIVYFLCYVSFVALGAQIVRTVIDLRECDRAIKAAERSKRLPSPVEYYMLPDPKTGAPYIFNCCPEPDQHLTDDEHGGKWMICRSCYQAWEAIIKPPSQAITIRHQCEVCGFDVCICDICPCERCQSNRKQKMFNSIPPIWEVAE